MKKHPRFLFTLMLMGLLFGLAGCTGAGSVTEISTEEAMEENTPEPTLAPVAEPVVKNDCLDCHTDKQRLINTAKPEEIVISENAGEG